MGIFKQYLGLKKENYIFFFGRIVTNLGAMVWPVLTMILNQKLGMDATDTALFVILTGFLFLPANVIGGHLADRFNRKWIIIVCDIASIILFISSGFMKLSITSIWVLMVGSFFQTLEQPSYHAVVAGLNPAHQREKAFSLQYLGGNIGLILSPTIAGLLFNNYLWLCFVLSGVAIGISTVLIGLFVHDDAVLPPLKPEMDKEDPEKEMSAMKVVLGSASLLIFLIAHSFYEGAYSQFGYLMPLDIARAFPDNGAVIYGTVTSTNCILVVAFTPIFTKIFEKVSLTRKYCLGTLLQALSFGSFLLSFGFIPGYYISIALFTFGEIMTTIVIGTYLSQRAPEEYRGRIFGINNFISAFMTGIVKWQSGQLFDASGPAPAWIFSIAMAFIAVVLARILVTVDRREYNI